MPRAHSPLLASPAYSPTPHTTPPAPRARPPAARPGSSRRAPGRRWAERLPCSCSRAGEEKERGGRESGRRRSGLGPGRASGAAAGGGRRRGRGAGGGRARRVRGRRGRAERCVLVGQFRAPRYVAARQPRVTGGRGPNRRACTRPRPAANGRGRQGRAGAGSPRPRPPSPPSAPPPRRRHYQLASLPGQGHRRPSAREGWRPMPGVTRVAQRPARPTRPERACGGTREPPVPPPRPLLASFTLPVAAVALRTPRPSLARRGAFCLPESRSRPGYLLPTEHCGLRLPGRGRDLGLPFPAHSREEPYLGVGRREGGGWRLASCQHSGRAAAGKGLARPGSYAGLRGGGSD